MNKALLTDKDKYTIFKGILKEYKANKNLDYGDCYQAHGLCYIIVEYLIYTKYPNVDKSFNYIKYKILEEELKAELELHNPGTKYAHTNYWFPTSTLFSDTQPFNPNDRIKILKQIIKKYKLKLNTNSNEKS